MNSAEIIQGGLKAATTSIKPLSFWSASLKTLVVTHPVGFLALTGSGVIGYGVCQFASEIMLKRKKKKGILAKQSSLAKKSDLPEAEKRDNVSEKKEPGWNLFKAEK